MLYRLEGVRRYYRMGRHTVKALDGIDLEIEVGAFHAIVGPSGSGKSTLLHLLGLLDRPTEGTVWFEGTDTSSLGEDHKATIRNRKVGFIFQQYHLIPVLNAYENIELPFLQNRVFSRQEVGRRIEQLIEAVGLQGYGAHRPAELSGGQQQRVAIARGHAAAGGVGRRAHGQPGFADR
jgi:putative ABC transport system ATP-binding protein